MELDGKYFPTKYDSANSELIATVAQDWGDWSGNSESPTGWFARVDMYDEREDIDLAEQLGILQWIDWDSIPGHYIVQGDSQGFVYVVRYESEAERDSVYARLEDEYAQWDSQDESEV